MVSSNKLNPLIATEHNPECMHLPAEIIINHSANFSIYSLLTNSLETPYKNLSSII